MKSYLLDSCILLWWLADSAQLPKDARNIIHNTNNILFISAATIWEIALKKALNKLDIPDNLMEVIDSSGFNHLSITAAHALKAASLPRHHNDPFDRILIAQAQEEKLILLTTDIRIKCYDIIILGQH